MSTTQRRNFLRGLATAAGVGQIGPQALIAGASTVIATQAIAAGEHASGSKGVAAGQTRTLAEFASALRFEDIPAPIIQLAKDAMTDTVATATFGVSLPWSRMIADYARANGSGGRARILGVPEAQVHAPSAALANGAFAHAFELDNLTKPNSGCHPGATVFTAALAAAQERGSSGRDVITAFVAGVEVMIRIGRATRHSQEEHGFHAPGTTGPFGAAVACAHLLRLNAEQTRNALAIAASTASGLLEFAKSGTGGMVKRLHLGRAAESGLLAASLASAGFTGPDTAIEGAFGFLKVLCPDYDMDALTEGLGTTWLTQTVMMKRYACHITAHTPVEGTLALMKQYQFKGDDVAAIDIQAIDRAIRVNSNGQPKDILLAQYSIPFCVALALYRDPVDPRSFDASAIADPKIMGMASRITMRALPAPDNRSDMTSVVTITLKDGRILSQRTTAFVGTPEHPMDQVALKEKFLMLTRDFGVEHMTQVFQKMQNLELQKNVEWVGASN
jgi:2-methylcitrate dehydratase PrpD